MCLCLDVTLCSVLSLCAVDVVLCSLGLQGICDAEFIRNSGHVKGFGALASGGLKAAILSLCVCVCVCVSVSLCVWT